MKIREEEYKICIYYIHKRKQFRQQIVNIVSVLFQSNLFGLEKLSAY